MRIMVKTEPCDVPREYYDIEVPQFFLSYDPRVIPNSSAMRRAGGRNFNGMLEERQIHQYIYYSVLNCATRHLGLGILPWQRIG